MRKRAFQVAISAVLLTIVGAIDSSAIEVDSFGVKGGLAYSQIDMYAYRGSDWNADLTGGAFVEVALSAVTSVEASAVFVRRRGGYYDRSSHPDGALAWVNEAQVELDYMDFSLLARYRVPCRHAFSPVLIAGPSWGELLSSEYEQNDWRGTDWIGRSGWAVIVGVGLERSARRPRMSVDLLYRLPLSGFDEEKGGYAVEAHGFSLLLGVGF